MICLENARPSRRSKNKYKNMTIHKFLLHERKINLKNNEAFYEKIELIIL